MQLSDLKYNLKHYLEGDLAEETKLMLRNFGYIPKAEAEAVRQAAAKAEADQAAKMLIDVADTHPTFKVESTPAQTENGLIADARRRAESAKLTEKY